MIVLIAHIWMLVLHLNQDMTNFEWICFLIVLITALYINNVKYDVETESVDMGEEPEFRMRDSFKSEDKKNQPLMLKV